MFRKCKQLLKVVLLLSMIIILFNHKKMINRNKKQLQRERFSKHKQNLSTNGTSHTNEENKYGKKKQKTLNKTRVFIVTAGRSGSSFLGELLKNHPDVMYYYEPMAAVLKSSNHKADRMKNLEIAQYFDEIFLCNLQLNKLKYLNSPNSLTNRLRSKYTKEDDKCKMTKTCRHIYSILHPLEINRACLNEFTHIVTKELQGRFPHGLEGILLDKFHENTKIIQLVRDPRAMMLSMAKQGWLQNIKKGHVINWDQVKAHCDKIWNAFTFLKKSKFDWILIRYEDLCENIDKVLNNILSFINLSSNKKYENYIQQIKSEDKINNNPYSTNKNMIQTYQRWRSNISISLSKGVEKVCKNIMELFGYKRVGNDRKLLQNKSVSLHK